MNNLDTDNRYTRAKERVGVEKKFYTSLISYTLFIVFLAGLNYYTNGWQNTWFLWAAFGWGIGLVIKAVKVFGLISLFGEDWEDRKIKEFMNEGKIRNDGSRK